MGSGGLSMHIHANAHDWGQMPMFEGKIGQAFRSFTSKLWQAQRLRTCRSEK
jgi:hypothetical protein